MVTSVFFTKPYSYIVKETCKVLSPSLMSEELTYFSFQLHRMGVYLWEEKYLIKFKSSYDKKFKQ